MHAVGEEVTGDSLDNVLGEFPTVGLELALLASSGDALVDDTGATEPVLTQPWFHIGQATTRWQGDEHDPGLHGESQGPNLDGLAG